MMSRERFEKPVRYNLPSRTREGLDGLGVSAAALNESYRVAERLESHLDVYHRTPSVCAAAILWRTAWVVDNDGNETNRGGFTQPDASAIFEISEVSLRSCSREIFGHYIEETGLPRDWNESSNWKESRSSTPRQGDR